MPNLNKLRGAKNGTAVPNPQYGLSQARYHNSDSRLQPPGSRLQDKILTKRLLLTNINSIKMYAFLV